MTRRLVAELDIDFHDAIFRAAGSRRLYRAWETLRSQLMMFLMLRDALPEDYLDSWHRDHVHLLDVIRAGDTDVAETAIETHIGRPRSACSPSCRRAAAFPPIPDRCRLDTGSAPDSTSQNCKQ